MEVTCEPITDSKLTGSNIYSIAVDSSIAGSCAKCTSGSFPKLKLNQFDVSPDTGAISLRSSSFYPNKVSSGNGGLVALGACLSMPMYTVNNGTVDVPMIVNRYDRWTVTVVPVYMKGAPRSSDTSTEINQKLGILTDKILLSSPKHLGSDLIYVPNASR
jgi:hypothetical protein